MAAKLPVGLQLYSVRRDCAKDLGHVLKEVARMGYQGVEFAGYHGRSSKELKKMLDDVGLACCGTHTGLPTLLGDELEKTVAFHKDLGNPYLIVPSLDEKYTGTSENWRAAAHIFNTIADRLKPLGMFTGYHNHYVEFAPLADGSTPWDLFFANTRPEVIMQIDTGNAMHAGVDATPFISRYPGRALTVHLKEFSGGGGNDALLGEGRVPWAETFRLCETIGGTRWYIIEQENDVLPPLECVEKCLQNFRAMGK